MDRIAPKDIEGVLSLATTAVNISKLTDDPGRHHRNVETARVATQLATAMIAFRTAMLTIPGFAD